MISKGGGFPISEEGRGQWGGGICTGGTGKRGGGGCYQDVKQIKKINNFFKKKRDKKINLLSTEICCFCVPLCLISLQFNKLNKT